MEELSGSLFILKVLIIIIKLNSLSMFYYLIRYSSNNKITLYNK